MINPDIGTNNRKRDIILRIRRIESEITGKGDVANINILSYLKNGNYVSINQRKI